MIPEEATARRIWADTITNNRRPPWDGGIDGEHDHWISDGDTVRRQRHVDAEATERWGPQC